VDGKEALLMLARDIATAKQRPLLKDLIIVLAPIFNADGNERMSKTNRPGQIGPAEGMGIRANSQGFDLNRDFVKLESPEVRALVGFFNQWDPAIFIDCHTTNGSHHRYTLTYEGPRVPAGDKQVIAFVRDKLFPDVGRRLEQHGGFKSYFYGNFSRDRKRWETVPATPRYGTLYYGLRNRIGILSESYSYASYKDRILASLDFVLSILEFTADNKERMRTLLEQARMETVRAGSKPAPDDQVAIQTKSASAGNVNLLGYAEEIRNGRRVRTDQTQEYKLEYWGGSEPTLSVRRPHAYLLPNADANVIATLQRHGIEVNELREAVELDVEAYKVTKISRASRLFEKHSAVSLEVTVHKDKRRLAVGTTVILTA
jgi:hypothetical protein